MNIFKKRWTKGFIGVGLVFCLVLCSTSMFASDDDTCEKAWIKCSADAVIGGLLSGPQTFLLISAGCFMGYTWCLKYYVAED